MDTDWTPEACTLPVAAKPPRMAEFASLFAAALRGADRLSPTQLRLELDAASRAEVHRLAEAESVCCAFFTFTIGEPHAGSFTVDIAVPEEHRDVLDGIAAQAAAS